MQSIEEYPQLPKPFVHIFRIEGYSAVKIYYIFGSFVAEVKDGWDGRNSEGKEVRAGIYFLKFYRNNVKKIIKLR